jgi:hypothetical protein
MFSGCWVFFDVSTLNIRGITMRKILLAISMVAVSGFAFAAEPGGVSATVHGGASGMNSATGSLTNVSGNTAIAASAENTSAVASGNAVARNTIAGIRGSTTVTGDTAIAVSARNTSAVATDNSTAENSIGVIGGQ